MVVASHQELVERIWSRDPTVWTDSGEEKWLGWLDEPKRMEERIGELREFADGARTRFETFVLLGMGGSSLAPEVLKRTFGVKSLHVLDTTHPAMLRHAAELLDLQQTMFVVSSKSGTTLETRSHFDYYWEQAGGKGDQFVAVTDPGSELEQRAKERGMRVFPGEPTIGGRYSALSPFGLVPAALMGLDLERILGGAVRMADACRADQGPGLQLGLQLGEGWAAGRDKVCLTETEGRFGLWAEQLIAESTGKQGKGLVPAPGEDPRGGPDRQHGRVRLDDLQPCHFQSHAGGQRHASKGPGEQLRRFGDQFNGDSDGDPHHRQSIRRNGVRHVLGPIAGDNPPVFGQCSVSGGVIGRVPRVRRLIRRGLLRGERVQLRHAL